MEKRNNKRSNINKILRKISRVPLILYRNGFFHSLNLIYIYFILPCLIKIMSSSLIFYRALKLLKKKCSIDKDIACLKLKKDEILKTGEKGYRLNIKEFGLSDETLALIKDKRQHQQVVIARIDHDGFLLSNFGTIDGAPTVETKEFMPRKRFVLDVVATGEYVGVKKYYENDKISFVNEIQALYSLAITGCNMPAIIGIDFDNLTLTISYIQGKVVREELAKKGAILRDRDVNDHPDYADLPAKQKRLKCIQQGKCFLYDVISEKQIEGLFQQLRKIHNAGFALKDIKYGNFIIEEKTGELFIIDFDYSRNYNKTNKCISRLLYDRDIENFNLHFDTDKLTYKSFKEKIQSNNIPAPDKWYAPVYFGNGLRIGLLWDLNVGYGRWHYLLKHHLPELSDKRILDLGANNASNGLMMLKNGASEVIGVELDKDHIEQGNFVKEAFEWVDSKAYNFRYIHANMKEVIKMDLGRFDFVTAFCSIYYLDDDSIAELIRHISTITDTFILQCNIGSKLGRADDRTYIRASVSYALKALENNGFKAAKVIVPRWYSRPLIIAEKIQ